MDTWQHLLEMASLNIFLCIFRNEYLINNYQTLDQFGYLEDDDELKTYAKKPESATKISPPFILETYMNKILETTEDLDDR